MQERNNLQSFYVEDPRIHQRDACGVGFIAHLQGKKNHQMIKDGLTILHRLDHRGGRASDGKTGDGAGIMIQIPDLFFRRQLAKRTISLPEFGRYAVGMMFLPKENELRQELEDHIAKIVAEEGLRIIGWRDVPVDSSVLGMLARKSEPCIKQLFIEANESDDFLWQLFSIRKSFEVAAAKKLGQGQTECYIASLSSETIVYKGLLLSNEIDNYYLDLKDENLISAFAMVHQRFSTNTLPAWPLAQPFRYIGHNGEINTLRGNLNWMAARSALLADEDGRNWSAISPVCSPAGSDSANLDNAIEFLLQTGRSFPQVLSMLIPEPWESHESMSPELKAYYEYQSFLMEPWDGPAFVGFANGDTIGAVLDRNGLRPGRYVVTEDQRVIMASESGVLDIDELLIKEKGRLSPGRMFIVDMKKGVIIPDEQIKRDLANAQSYSAWLDAQRILLDDLKPSSKSTFRDVEAKELNYFQQRFAYSREDIKFILKPMAESSKEPIGSMGNDTPIAALSQKRPLLYNYFKQLFAQVTNPPIDAIREQLVTSLSVRLGGQKSILREVKEQCHALYLHQPLLSSEQFAKLNNHQAHTLKLAYIDICYQAEITSLKEALDSVCDQAEKLVSNGAEILILSDRAINKDKLAVPALLVVSAVHHHLIRAGLRTRCSIVLASGEPREVHHFCTLIGFGAEAIYPYLALETVRFISHESPSDQSRNYLNAASSGILKVMSKMGISTLQSYCGAQIFEALGLSSKLVERYFTGTTTRIEGVDLEDIEADVLALFQCVHDKADLSMQELGQYHWRREGELHLHNPMVITGLQKATRIRSREEFKNFCDTIDSQSEAQITLRGLFEIKSKQRALDIDDVEPVTSIMKRFSTGAMSFGSISKEAHESIAIAMNRIGARSNSGEGGEDAKRFIPDEKGDLKRSAIKQVASGRFGVTSHYLVNADEIQIKMAQGAKPGEGGQLPGHKVDQEIARVRHSTPGVPLISPPPHHDIYSIEDLAQLIFDLKNANHRADISVKLVSAVGVGTIASGVAKAKADAILISGYEGGTGASPLTSIKHAGLPWELGLSETHRMLSRNSLRSRVRLIADGQLRTPRDLAIATMLGADEWSIGTGALITMGCIMMRKCHLNNCPVGIATQDPALREKFSGKPEHLINYIYLLAEGLRELMAKLGIASVDELVGRSDLLEQRQVSAWKRANKLDLSQVLDPSDFTEGTINGHREKQDHELSKTFDQRILLAHCLPAIKQKQSVQGRFSIANTDRSVGTHLSSKISELYGAVGLPKSSIDLKFEGSAGQSFMAFGASGIKATVYGDVNDYCGKGLSGAEIIVRPKHNAKINSQDHVICGNTSLYGATSGKLFIRGIAGERFAVRNSGAIAVAEGIGDHGCEYMTGGRVLVLGSIGRNFAAGMSGGIAYLVNCGDSLKKSINHELVECRPLLETTDEDFVKSLLSDFSNATASPLALKILSKWETYRLKIVQIIPVAYRRILEQQERSQFQSSSIPGRNVIHKHADLEGLEKVLEIEQGGFHG